MLIKRTTILVLLLITSFNLTVKGQSMEYTLKAAFIERFTRFVEWPESAKISDTSKVFVIGVIGENPFGSDLNNFFSNQKIKNKTVKIKYISNIEDILGCHFLFISESEKNSLSEILSFTEDKPILTVGDTPGFAKEGVGINLITEKDKIKFEINIKSVSDKGIKPSSQLITYATATYNWP